MEVKFAIEAEPIWAIELAASLKILFVGSSSENPKEQNTPQGAVEHHRPHVLKNSQKAIAGGQPHEQGSQVAHLA